MAITSGELELRFSGGAANSDPNASIGGAKSSVSVTDNTLHNLFDVVSSAEATSGDMEYRCLYLHNANGTLTLYNAYVYIDTQTPSTSSEIAIVNGTSAIDGQEQGPLADEDTEPTGIGAWVTGTGSGNAISLGDVGPGSHKAFWIRREITAAAGAYSNDSVIIQVGGDTPA